MTNLDTTPFGAELVTALAAKLEASSSGLYHCHRDYCGHGLVYDGGRFRLLEVLDGMPQGSKELAAWDRAAFVAFWSAQSDFTCSGRDPATPLLFTEDAFLCGNQRLTAARIRAFVDG